MTSRVHTFELLAALMAASVAAGAPFREAARFGEIDTTGRPGAGER